MLIYVRMYVRPVQVCLEQSIFIFLGQRAVREHSENTRRALKQSEPKILRLVNVGTFLNGIGIICV